MADTTSCGLCGESFTQKGGRGRPRSFCPDSGCADLSKSLSRLGMMFSRLPDDMPLKARRRIRGELFRAANLLNKKGGN